MSKMTTSTPIILSDSLFSVVVDRAPEPILLTTAAGIIVYANKEVGQLFGYTTDELRGRSIVEISEGIPNGNWAEIVETTKQAGSATQRSMVRSRDGSALRVEVAGSALQQDGATVLCFMPRRIPDPPAAESVSDLFALSTAFYATPDPMIVVSEADDTVLLVNDAFESITGHRRAHALFRTTTDFNLWFDPDDYQRLKSNLTTGSPATSFEVKIRTKSGEIRHASVSASRLQQQQDNKALLIIRDITNEKRAEEALRLSEAMFARVFRSSPHLVTITTLADGVFVDVNEAFEQTSGYSRSEIVGRTAVEMEVWASETERAEFAAALAEAGSIRDMDVRWRIKSGEVRIGRLSAETMELGGRAYIVSVIQDITDVTAAEEARKRSEERFSKAFHASPHLAAITSLETGEFIDINDGFERLSGYKRSEVIGRRTLDFNLWETPEMRTSFVDEIRRNGRVHEQEIKVKTRAGEVRTGLISAQPIEIDDEECIITVIQDITGRKKTEDALKDYAQRLKTLREIDVAILTSVSVEEIVVGATRHLFDLPGCIHVGCYIREGEQLRRVGGHTRQDYSPEYMDIEEHAAVLEPVLRGRTLIVENARAERSHLSGAPAEVIDSTGMGSFFMVPLTSEGQHIGALGVVFDRENAFSDMHVELARDIANPVAVAIERMRLQDELTRTNARLSALSKQLVEAQESERRYLARELHDHIGQMLTAAKISLQQARDLTNEESLAASLDEHISIIGRTLEEVRGLSLNLRPSILDDFGLVPALEWLADRISGESRFRIIINAEPAPNRLPADIELTCFRVAQEALANAARHAAASQVAIQVGRMPNRVVLTIKDDGRGFDVDEAFLHASAGQSLGLLGMGERVRLVGGILEVTSNVGTGTTVTASLPVPESNSR